MKRLLFTEPLLPEAVRSRTVGRTCCYTFQTNDPTPTGGLYSSSPRQQRCLAASWLFTPRDPPRSGDAQRLERLLKRRALILNQRFKGGHVVHQTLSYLLLNKGSMKLIIYNVQLKGFQKRALEHFDWLSGGSWLTLLTHKKRHLTIQV